MAGWTVKSNKLGIVAERLPKNLDQGVDETAREMAQEFARTLWKDTGLLRNITVARTEGELHAEVWIGYNPRRGAPGVGFYAAYQEFGTKNQAARPIVGPTAHEYEQILVAKLRNEVKKACAV